MKILLNCSKNIKIRPNRSTFNYFLGFPITSFTATSPSDKSSSRLKISRSNFAIFLKTYWKYRFNLLYIFYNFWYIRSSGNSFYTTHNKLRSNKSKGIIPDLISCNASYLNLFVSLVFYFNSDFCKEKLVWKI